jgi:aryl-alcohol dehydrogenase-like predicted oxidoreductase
MEYFNLGRSGLKVSQLCLGTMQFGWTADESTAFDVLDSAFQAGLNFIDTADVYSRWVEGNPGGVAETILGKWMKQNPGRRQQIVLATKVRGRMGDGPNDEGLSRVHIMEAVEASLRRLQVEAIDLYQLHSPDQTTPVEETLRALDDLVRGGKVRYIGCSNFKAWQLMEALWTSDRSSLESFASLQPHYNLLHRQEYEAGLQAVCLEHGLGVIPYSPLAGGFLTGKYKRGEEPPEGSRGAGSSRMSKYLADDRTWAVMEALEQIAERHGASQSQIALAWTMQQPGITSPIIGPRSVEQLEDNLGAVSHVLADEDIEALDSLTKA